MLTGFTNFIKTPNSHLCAYTNGLVSYWPFSGNLNTGIVNGATLTKDRFGNANNAYSFNGLIILLK